MSLAGYLSEYSLAEIFHFVQDGNQTGLLSIEPISGSTKSTSNTYSLSFQSGRIMSVINGWEHKPLLKTIEQRRWLTPAQISTIETQLSLLPQPLGTYLKSRNLINTEQLTLLFNSHVIATTCKLFELHDGQFKFDPEVRLNHAEMTGISLTAQELALLGLRMLKNWDGLTAKLPAPEFALQRFSTELKGIRLDSQEFKVWQLALGEMSIAQIAEKLELEIARVQQISFRLSSIGLVQELSVEPPQPPIDQMRDVPKPICVGGGNANTPISASFLSNLMGFLKKKG
jgi:Domain of unknown function (DUF4388)